jgi:hypothetical protein
MFEVEDEPIETLHIYFEREQPPRPSVLPIVLSVVALSILIAIGVLSPAQQPVMRAVIRVPAVLLPPRTFTAQTPVIPTGIKTYPATTAHGTLTITNGSIIAQILPAGFTTVSHTGVSVVTDRAVFVSAGSANGYGYATVKAHALVSGKAGNLTTLAINQVIGSSVYIRNLHAFSGGRDSYSVKVVTAQDRSVATAKARNMLLRMSTGLHYPCNEAVSVSKGVVRISWRCQMLTYYIPAFYHVTGVKISGKYLLLAVWLVARPVRIWVK